MGSLPGCRLLFLFFLTTFLFFSPSKSSSSFSSLSSSTSSSSAVHDNKKAIVVRRPTKLIDSICNKTTNYKFCVDALYTDPRASKADEIVLAYISFGLAYTNATNTQAYIRELVNKMNATATGAKKNKNESNSNLLLLAIIKGLKRCGRDYEKAVSALEEAYNNLNSETYFDLGELAGVAAHAAVHCQHVTFKPIIRHDYSPLTRRNKDLTQLCAISAVISSYFTT